MNSCFYILIFGFVFLDQTQMSTTHERPSFEKTVLAAQIFPEVNQFVEPQRYDAAVDYFQRKFI